jgi:hypothetical protein
MPPRFLRGLEDFERFYLDTLREQYALKTLRVKATTNMINELDVRRDFETACLAVIDFAVQFRTCNDPAIFCNLTAAVSLERACRSIVANAPPASASVSATLAFMESVQCSCIALRGFCDFTAVAYDAIMNCVKALPKDRFTPRFALPYVYAQLLIGRKFDEIGRDDVVRYALTQVEGDDVFTHEYYAYLFD